MPKGVPVGTLAIGGAANAGLLAVQILAAHDSRLQQKLLDYKHALIVKVEAMDKDVRLQCPEFGDHSFGRRDLGTATRLRDRREMATRLLESVTAYGPLTQILGAPDACRLYGAPRLKPMDEMAWVDQLEEQAGKLREKLAGLEAGRA